MAHKTKLDLILEELTAIRSEQAKQGRTLYGEESSGASGVLSRVKSLEVSRATMNNRIAVWSGICVGVSFAFNAFKKLGGS